MSPAGACYVICRLLLNFSLQGRAGVILISEVRGQKLRKPKGPMDCVSSPSSPDCSREAAGSVSWSGYFLCVGPCARCLATQGPLLYSDPKATCLASFHRHTSRGEGLPQVTKLEGVRKSLRQKGPWVQPNPDQRRG